MIVKIDDNAIAAIEAVLKRGNKAIIQRKGSGVIVMEEERKIKYRTDPIGDRERVI